MKKLFLLLMFMMALGFAAPSHAMGLFYTNTTYPVLATGVSAEHLKVYKKGEAMTKNYVWMVELGDASIRRASINGGIKQVHFVDVQEKSYFLFYRTVKTIVYGE